MLKSLKYLGAPVFWTRVVSVIAEAFAIVCPSYRDSAQFLAMGYLAISRCYAMILLYPLPNLLISRH